MVFFFHHLELVFTLMAFFLSLKVALFEVSFLEKPLLTLEKHFLI
jgi:hypothetical protein